MLGIIIIAYHSAQLTIDFIRREMKNIDVPWVCCIVNNAAIESDTKVITDGTGAETVGENLVTDAPKEGEIYIIPSAENLGFAKGNNLGVKFLMQNFDCDYLLFSNNDIEIKSPNCLSRLIETLESNPEIGAIGPRIMSLDGSEQLPHDGYVSIYRQIGWHLLPFLRKKHKQVAVEDMSTAEKRSSGYTYWTQGSFFVMRMKDFLKVGMFDPNTFLYAEEPILAEKLKRIGKRFYYENSVSVLHYEGGTIVKQHGSRKSDFMVMESNCYYYLQYLHYHPLLVWLYRTTFKLNRFFMRNGEK